MSEVDGQMITADSFPQLLADIRAIIVEARRSVYAGINAIQIDHNWNIGRRIVEEEQGGKLRAEYGKRTIAKLSAHLCAEFGEGYSERYIWEFRRSYVTFPDIKILHTRVPNLSWSHFRSIMRLRDPYSILKGNEQIFATKYQLNIPTPEELTEEVAKQRATLLIQLAEQEGGDAK